MPKKPGRSTKSGAARARGVLSPGDEVRTVSFVSLGCPKNLVDSEKMLGLLAEDGLIPVSAGADGLDWGHESADAPPAPAGSTSPSVESQCGLNLAPPPEIDPADAVVINTCGFLEASKEESLGVIRQALRAKQEGLVKRVVVAGCLVQRHRAKLLDWAPGIDAMVGVFDRDKVVEAVRGPRAPRADLAQQEAPYWVAANALQAAKARGLDVVGLTVQGQDGKGVGYYESDAARLRLTPRHYAYLRVSEGCNQNCAFCTIPSIRGKMRSKPLDRLRDEARELVLDGAFELNLIGQDTTSFGDDIGVPYDPATGRGGLVDLLRAVCDAAHDAAGGDGPGRAWVRLMYAYPSNFADGMIDAFADLCARGPLVPYIDIPLQHASDRVLSAMRRRVTARQQRTLMEKLRARVPGLCVRTTFISGFPGETEDDHRELLEFVERVGFEAVGVFEYSHEGGTVAGTMEEDPALAVPPEVKARRRGEVMALQQRLAHARNRALAERFDPARPEATGVRVPVLIDRAARAVGAPTAGVGRGGRLYQGRTPGQAPQIDAVTFVQSRQELAPGELVPCVIVDADGYDLIARPLSDLERRHALRVVR